jgi:hypothetical protein
MRFVIYDDATLEPITVVNIRGFTEWDIESHGCRYHLHVPSEICSYREVGPNMPIEDLMRIVDLKFERIVRVKIDDGSTQHSWMCFTKQEELALLLTPDWLPGQRGAVEHIQRHNERLNELLLKLIMGAR